MIWFLAHNHNVISYYHHIRQEPKELVQLVLNNISCHCWSKRHYSIPKSPKLDVESCKERWSFIKLLVPITFLTVTHRVIIQASACTWAMSSSVLKWYGSLTITMFRLVGSKQIQSLKLPNLSFPSTSTKLLIQGVYSCTGFRTPALSILSMSCQKAPFKCTRIGLQGVCLGVIFWSKWIQYGGTWKASNTLKTSGYLCKICSLLVTNLGTSCFASSTVTTWFVLWADTGFYNLCTDTFLVFFGWSNELVIKLALGG